MTVHTQASYGIAHTTTGKFWLDQKPGDLHWNITDTGWAKAAWSSYFGPLICGSCVFVDDTDFNPQHTLELLQRYPITTMCGAPTIYRMLVQQDLSGFKPASLRHCVAAGEPLNPEVIDRWREATGITVRDGYGQTETVLLCGNFPGMDIKEGSMGKPSPGFDLAVIDLSGAIVAANEEGDIAVRVKPRRPVGLFKEYRNAVTATRGAFRGDWYITGDRAFVDEDGYFWFVGRSDDVIITSGYRIGPFEVESILLEHDAVVESAVVSSPDETRGEVVKAFIVLSAGYEPGDELRAELQQHVKSITAPYKYPRKIEFVESLPKTVSGKIRRKELRDREWQKT
jgi:acetyl-CoA synthetase/medium-chain acyl-CoA synthetase